MTLRSWTSRGCVVARGKQREWENSWRAVVLFRRAFALLKRPVGLVPAVFADLGERISRDLVRQFWTAHPWTSSILSDICPGTDWTAHETKAAALACLALVTGTPLPNRPQCYWEYLRSLRFATLVDGDASCLAAELEGGGVRHGRATLDFDVPAYRVRPFKVRPIQDRIARILDSMGAPSVARSNISQDRPTATDRRKLRKRKIALATKEIANGKSVRAACNEARISRATFYRSRNGKEHVLARRDSVGALRPPTKPQDRSFRSRHVASRLNRNGPSPDVHE